MARWPVHCRAGHQSGSQNGETALTFTGGDVFMHDYLRSELLDRLPDAYVSFLTRTSALERMSGPLCDAVLEDRGSAGMLAELARSNLLLIPLDRRGEWYRYHHLFRDLLLAELHPPGARPDSGPEAASGEVARRQRATW
jgi:LuxR family maltose regulon positive regulatory protein